MKTIRYNDIVTTFAPSFFHNDEWVIIQENEEGILSSGVFTSIAAGNIYTELSNKLISHKSKELSNIIAGTDPIVNDICFYCKLEQRDTYKPFESEVAYVKEGITYHKDNCVWVQANQ